MKKLFKKFVWVRRTLFGYTVMFVSVERNYTVVHRPFRQPLMTSEKTTPTSFRGKSYTAIIFDEVVPYPKKNHKGENLK